MILIFCFVLIFVEFCDLEVNVIFSFLVELNARDEPFGNTEKEKWIRLFKC